MKNSKRESAPAAFRVEVRPTADKDLDNLSEEIQERVLDKLDDLETNPQPRGCVKLKSEKNRYRIRVGDYRVVYRIDNKLKLVLVEFIMHRKDVYRKLD